jgi:hypothetical protein
LGRPFLLPGRNQPSLIDTAGAEQAEAQEEAAEGVSETQEMRREEVTVEEPVGLETPVGLGTTVEAGRIAAMGTAAGEE